MTANELITLTILQRPLFSSANTCYTYKGTLKYTKLTPTNHKQSSPHYTNLHIQATSVANFIYTFCNVNLPPKKTMNIVLFPYVCKQY